MILHIFFTILLLGAAFCGWRIGAIDFRRRIIPDVYLWPMMLVGLVLTAYCPWWPTTPQMAAFGAAFGYALALITGLIFERHAKTTDAPIGLGDVKLIGVGGLWLGPTGLAIALAVSCIFGMIWGRRHDQKYIPFAPFFLPAAILSLLGILLFVIIK